MMPVHMSLPYISGFLAFREEPLITPLIRRLQSTRPDLAPQVESQNILESSMTNAIGTLDFDQVIIVDGNGVLHPRMFGTACHIGVKAGIPTIGVAKTFLNVDGLTEPEVKARANAELRGDSRTDEMRIVGVSGRLHGVALRTSQPTQEVTQFKPLYVSVGHRRVT